VAWKKIVSNNNNTFYSKNHCCTSKMNVLSILKKVILYGIEFFSNNHSDLYLCSDDINNIGLVVMMI